MTRSPEQPPACPGMFARVGLGRRAVQSGCQASRLFSGFFALAIGNATCFTPAVVAAADVFTQAGGTGPGAPFQKTFCAGASESIHRHRMSRYCTGASPVAVQVWRAQSSAAPSERRGDGATPGRRQIFGLSRGANQRCRVGSGARLRGVVSCVLCCCCEAGCAGSSDRGLSSELSIGARAARNGTFGVIDATVYTSGAAASCQRAIAQASASAVWTRAGRCLSSKGGRLCGRSSSKKRPLDRAGWCA